MTPTFARRGVVARNLLPLTAALASLNLADAFTTFVGLRRGFGEAAPLAGSVLTSGGSTALLVLGGLGFLVELTVLRLLPRSFRAFGWTMVLGLSFVPVLSNVAVLVR